MDNKKPRIAFCFSGQARTLDQTYLFFQKNLFDAAKEQGFDYDVFCAVEDDEDADKVNLLNPTKVEKIKSNEVEKIIEEIYGNFIRNELYKYGYFTHTGIYSLLQQIYKVQRNILMVEKNKYDLILRLRFDTIFLNKLNFSSIFEETKKGGIICNIAHVSGMMAKIAHKFLFSYHEISDLYFIGGNDMKKFSNIFDSFQDVVVLNHKTYKSLNGAYKMTSKMNNFVNSINKRYGRIIIPTTLVNGLAKLFGLQVFVGDSYYCKFLQGVKLYKIDICIFLLRKKIEDSLVRLRKKTFFEK